MIAKDVKKELLYKAETAACYIDDLIAITESQLGSKAKRIRSDAIAIQNLLGDLEKEIVK